MSSPEKCNCEDSLELQHKLDEIKAVIESFNSSQIDDVDALCGICEIVGEG